MKMRSMRGVGALAAFSAMLFLSGCDQTVTIKQNENGNYVYDPGLLDLEAGKKCTVVFKDAANVAAHAVEIRVPGATPTAPATVVTTGRVLPGGEWRWTIPANTYPVGTRLSVSEPASAGGQHNTERGTLRFN